MGRQLQRNGMDCRVKPGNDEARDAGTLAAPSPFDLL
jgi:hypothetical protein